MTQSKNSNSLCYMSSSMTCVSHARCMAPSYAGIEDDVGNMLLNFVFVLFNVTNPKPIAQKAILEICIKANNSK
jgi:hypothetical protein